MQPVVMINKVVRIYELVIHTSVQSLPEVNTDGNCVIMPMTGCYIRQRLNSRENTCNYKDIVPLDP